MIKREELTNPNSCMSRAKDDEMTFVLLARDAAAPVAIRAWIAERIRLEKNSLCDPQILDAYECALAMEKRTVVPPAAPSSDTKSDVVAARNQENEKGTL